MKRLASILSGFVLALTPKLAMATDVGGGYEGIASIYFTFIAIILIYGAYDVIGPKPYRGKVMMVLAPAVAIFMYLMLPE